MPNPNQIVRVIELGVQQTGHVNSRDMQLAIAALAQENARRRVTTATIVALVNSSGGTPAAALAAVVSPTVAAQNGVTLLAPKAGFDTQIGLIRDAHRELRAKVNAYIAAIAAGSATVADLPLGAAPDGTIGAITPALTGVTAAAAGVASVTGLLEINKARNTQASLCAAVNWVRVAQGLAPIADGSGGVFTRTQTSYPTYDAAATAAAAGTGENSLAEVPTENALLALTNNIATLAVSLNVANGPAIGPFVVATNNPRFRFVGGDVTP